MSSIASLVFNIGADSANLKSDLDKANKKVKNWAGGMKGLTKGVAGAFTAIGTAIAGIGLTTAGVYAALKSQIDYADALGETAQKLGVTTQALSSYRYAAKLSGVEAETLEKSITFLNKNMLKSEDVFKKLGISVRDSNGNMRSATDILTDTAAVFKQLPDGPQKAALAMKLFGKSGAEIIPLLNQGADGIKELQAEAAKMGLVITDDQANAAGKFNDALDKIYMTIQGALTQTFAALAPYLEATANWLLEMVAKFNELDPSLKLTIIGVGALGTALVALGAIAAVVGVAINFAFAPITLIILAITAVIAGLVAAWVYWDEIVQYTSDLLSNVFTSVVDGVTWAFEGLVSVIGDLLGWFEGLGTYIADVIIAGFNFLAETVDTVFSIIGDLLSAIGSLFTLDFGGFAESMKSAFTTAKDWFESSFLTALGNIASAMVSGLSTAAGAVVDAFSEKFVSMLNWLRDQLTGLLDGVKSFIEGIDISFGGDGTVSGYGGKGNTRGDVAKGTLKTNVPTSNLGAIEAYAGSGGAGTTNYLGGYGTNYGTPLGTAVLPAGMNTGNPLTSALGLLPPGNNEAIPVEVINDILEDDDGKGGGGGGGGGGGAKGSKDKPDPKKKTEEMSTEFLDFLKSGFSKALVTGNWKEFGASIMDNITMKIIDSFSNSLMDALFKDINFDKIFTDFGDLFGNQIDKTMTDVATNAGGGGKGLLGGLFSWIGSIFGFAEGGLVPADTPYSRIGRDSVPALLTPGELVVPVGEVDNFLNGGGRGSGATANINITGDIDRQTEQVIMRLLPSIAQGVNSFNHEAGIK